MVDATFAHVLLLEQRAGARQLMHEVLEEFQYRVSLAASAVQAQRTLAQGDVDLLIADATNGGVAVRNLTEYAAHLGVPCVLISPGPIAKGSFRKNTATFIEHPFTLAHLCSEVARTLTARRAPGGHD